MVEKIRKSDEEWRCQLTPEEYRVARDRDTEKRFSHPEHDAKVTGVYHCVCCGVPLFDGKAKFESGTGWPSFWTPVSEQAIETRPDLRYDDDLTEVVCACCGAHLGHVFEDGPEPTGLRYCINGVCMTREDVAYWPDHP